MLAAMTRSLTALVGTDIEVRLTSRGIVTHVKGIAAAMQEAMKGLPIPVPEKKLDDADFTSNVQGLFVVLPEAAAAIGDTWEHARTQKGHGPTTEVSAKMTLDQVNAETAVIKETGEYAQPAHGGTGGADTGGFGMSVTIDDGKSSGQIVVSRKDGLPVSWTASHDVTTSMQNPMAPDGAGIVSHAKTSRVIERVTAHPEKSEKSEKSEKTAE